MIDLRSRGRPCPEDFAFMRMRTSVVFSLVFSLILPLAAHAQGTGRSLDIQPGGRQNGMGAAGVALPEDATGVSWWNPAGLGFVEKSAVELTYAQLVPGLASDVNYNYGTYVHPMGSWGAAARQPGVPVLRHQPGLRRHRNLDRGFRLERIRAADLLRHARAARPRGGRDAQVRAHPARALEPERRRLDVRAWTWAGSTRSRPRTSTSASTCRTWGPSVTFINEDQASPLEPQPQDWHRVGGRTHASSSRSRWSGDFNQSLVTSDFRVYNYGAELRFADQLSGRIGYYDDPLGEIQDLTYGLGINWHSLSLDFASIPQAKNSGLENVKKITLGYRF